MKLPPGSAIEQALLTLDLRQVKPVSLASGYLERFWFVVEWVQRFSISAEELFYRKRILHPYPLP